MDNGRPFKSSEVLVLRAPPGLRLVHIGSGSVRVLTPREVESWVKWDDPWLLTNEFQLSEPFIAFGSFRAMGSENEECNQAYGVIPKVRDHQIKWYEESPDLCVVFNTEAMGRNNPLIVLGPYGTLCWRGIIEKWPIGRIREDAQRVFGVDEVMQFMRRLVDLGLVANIPGISGLPVIEEKLLKEFPAPLVQFRLPHAKIPWYCLWEISTACNLRCKTCYLTRFADGPPTTEASLALAAEIINSGIFYVSIIGGEPLLRSDLEQIVRALRDKGLFVKIITNGTLLTFKRARSLKDAGLNQIEVSFDGISQQTDDSTRGIGTHVNAKRAVAIAQSVGIPRVGIVLTIHSGNISELPGLPGFLTKLGTSECYLSLFRKTGTLGGQSPFGPLEYRMIGKVQEQLTMWKRSYPRLEITLLPTCTCGRTSVVIGEDGHVRACPFSTRSVGNLTQSPFIDIWRSLECEAASGHPLGYCAERSGSENPWGRALP